MDQALSYRSIYQHNIRMRADMFSVLAIKGSRRATDRISDVSNVYYPSIDTDDPEAGSRNRLNATNAGPETFTSGAKSLISGDFVKGM